MLLLCQQTWPSVALSFYSWHDLRRGHENLHKLRQVLWGRLWHGQCRRWNFRDCSWLRRRLHDWDGICSGLPHIRAWGQLGEVRPGKGKKQDDWLVSPSPQVRVNEWMSDWVSSETLRGLERREGDITVIRENHKQKVPRDILTNFKLILGLYFINASECLSVSSSCYITGINYSLIYLAICLTTARAIWLLTIWNKI